MDRENYVENWTVAGIMIGINKENLLNNYCFYKLGFGTKLIKHPQSNIVFKNCKIPYYKESIDMVK